MKYDLFSGSDKGNKRQLPDHLKPEYLSFQPAEADDPYIFEVDISSSQSRSLYNLCQYYIDLMDGQMETSGEGSRLVARAIKKALGFTFPTLSKCFRQLRRGDFNALHIRGLPKDPMIAEHLILALTYKMGEPFSYTSQYDGRLVMPIVAGLEADDRRKHFLDAVDIHSDDAAVPRECRAEWVSILTLNNSAKTMFGYVPISKVFAELSAQTKSMLFDKSVMFRPPERFNLEADVWVGPRPILSISPTRMVEVAWPSWATRLLDSENSLMKQAIDELMSKVNKHIKTIIPTSGSLFVFNNFRGLNMRSKVSNGLLLGFRTHARRNLSALRHITGSYGQVFDLRPILEPEIIKN